MADAALDKVEWLYQRQLKWEDAFRFFIRFSAMEYALKNAGFLEFPEIRPRDNGDWPEWFIAEADWTEFGRAVDEHAIRTNILTQIEFERLREARRKLETTPPQSLKRRKYTNHICWRRTQRPSNQSSICWAIDCVKVVRNNLFHGNKYPAGRLHDRELITSGITLLETLVICCQRVRILHDSSDEAIKLRNVYDMYRQVLGPV